MNIIVQGLKSALLITQGYYTAVYEHFHRDVIQVDFSRAILQADMTRDTCSVAFPRSILQTIYARFPIRADMTRAVIETPED